MLSVIYRWQLLNLCWVIKIFDSRSPYILQSPMMPCSLDTLPLPTVSDFADLAEPFYSAIKQDVLEDSSSDLLEQVDIGDRNFFDQPQRWDLSPRLSKNLKAKFYGPYYVYKVDS